MTQDSPSREAIGRTHARVGLLGNPGDGYNGRALAVLIHDYHAWVTAAESPRIHIEADTSDGRSFESWDEAAATFEQGGLEDGARLIRAAMGRFWRLAAPDRASDPDRFSSGVRLRYGTTIPRQVGLSGSSALIISALRALAALYRVEIDPFDLAEAALAAEVEDLGIAAGAMDRVVQAYGGAVSMELAHPRNPTGYAAVPVSTLPRLFVAWDPQGGKSSGGPHGDLRARWLAGDPEVLKTLEELRELVPRGVTALRGGDTETFGNLISENFHLRTKIFHVGQTDRDMVQLANEHGCPAKLAGSGGAIVGMIGEGVDPDALRRVFEGSGKVFLIPTLSDRS